MRTTIRHISAAAITLAAIPAFAETTVYGLLDVGYGVNHVTHGQSAHPAFYSSGDTGNSLGNSTTHVGLKGSFDVGSEVKLNFKLESNGITSEGTVNDPTLGRAAWVGLSGSFGEFRLGRQDSVAYQVQNKFDLDWASNSTSALSYTMVAPYFRARQSAVLDYMSPKMGDTVWMASFKPAGNDTNAKNTLSLGVNYDKGPLSLGAAVESARTSTGKGFASVAGSYDFGAVKAMASYADGGNPNQGGTGKGWGLGVAVPVAGMTVGSHYANNTDTQERAWELFAQKELLKGLYGYVNAARLDMKGYTAPTGRYNNYGVGMIYMF